MVPKPRIGERMNVIILPLFLIPRWNAYVYSLSIIMLCGENARLVNHVLCVTSSAQGAFIFSSTDTGFSICPLTIPI